MQSDFRVETRSTGRASTLTLTGDLDLVSSPALAREFQRVLESDAELIVVDLRPLAFMDSSGLHALVAAQQRVQESGRRMVLVRGGQQVQRLFDLTGIGEILTVVDSAEQVLEVDPAPGGPER